MAIDIEKYRNQQKQTAADAVKDLREAYAVSYTHLDVYKRQPLRLRLCKKFSIKSNIVSGDLSRRNLYNLKKEQF